MYEGFIDKKAAAKQLNVSARTVYELLNSGRLRPAYQGRKAGVSTASLRQYIRAKNGAPLQESEALDLRLRQLEARVATVMRLLGVDAKPLSLRGTQLGSLHRMAEHNSQEGWSPHEERMWAEVFRRLDVRDLVLVETVTGHPQPWAAFYRLCAAMRHACFDGMLKDDLARGYANLHQLATVWVFEREPTVKKAEQRLRERARLDGRGIRKLKNRQASQQKR